LAINSATGVDEVIVCRGGYRQWGWGRGDFSNIW